jgi:hypothetical protein
MDTPAMNTRSRTTISSFPSLPIRKAKIGKVRKRRRVTRTTPYEKPDESNEPEEVKEPSQNPEEYEYAETEPYDPDSESEREDSDDRLPIEKELDFVFAGLPPICHCLSCFADMGDMNPRQYCCKRYCPYEGHEPMELALIRIAHLKGSSRINDPYYGYKIKRAIRYGKFTCDRFRG